ncbi:hypothetical protein VTO42DRAFT_3359 [Malbranchea cinnamomea]
MAFQNANIRHEALLLLAAPAPTSYASLRSAYGRAISTVLSTLSRSVRGTSHSVVLDIALATSSSLCAPESLPRSRSFARLQQLLAAFYRLLANLSVTEGIELDGPGGVDARVFFLDCSTRTTDGPSDLLFHGPVVSLSAVAASGRSWETVYSIATEQGDGLLQSFVRAQGQYARADVTSRIQKLPGGSIPPSSSSSSAAAGFVDEPTPRSLPHHSVAVGGTFDHLHIGHKLLLTATVLVTDPHPSQWRTVTIGVTGDELLVNKKYAEFLESWDERCEGIWKFLHSIVDFTPPDCRETKMERVDNPGPNGRRVIVTVYPRLRFHFVQISDPFGPTITDPEISALVVSGETQSGGKAVNDAREKKGWSLLEVFEVDVLELGDDPAEGKGASSDNFEAKISSTEIRRRRMNLVKG